MGITRSTLPRNNGNLPLPFFGGNYPIVLLNNIYLWLHMYINCFTRIIFFMIVYVIQEIGGNENSPDSLNVQWKQGNYPVIHIYGGRRMPLSATQLIRFIECARFPTTVWRKTSMVGRRILLPALEKVHLAPMEATIGDLGYPTRVKAVTV